MSAGAEFNHVDETFSEALIHSPLGHTVFGRRLLPLSYWHETLLLALENPFSYWRKKFHPFIGGIFDGSCPPFDFGALLQAVDICTSAHPAVPVAPGYFARQRRRFITFRYRAHFARELGKFSRYLADYRSRPVFGVAPGSEGLSVPVYLYEVALLRRFKPELDDSAAWNSQAAYSSWWTAAMVAAHGDKVKILTPAHREAMKEAGYESED